MKKVFILLIAVTIMMISCKSSKKATTSPYTPVSEETTTTPQPKIFTIPDSKTTTPTAAKPEPAVPVRKESFSFTQPQDNTQNRFFIIVGSFSSMDNAKNFKQTLISEGFTPIIVQSETGFYRVTVDSYNNETDARRRLLQVRENYPKYADTWLLIKQ